MQVYGGSQTDYRHLKGADNMKRIAGNVKIVMKYQVISRSKKLMLYIERAESSDGTMQHLLLA
jgi:hypothetical protein